MKFCSCNAVYLAAVLCLLLIIPATSVYKQVDLWGSQQWATTVVSSFGMARGGLLNVNYNIRAQNTSMPYNSYMLLVLVSDNQRTGWYPSMPTFSQNSIITEPDFINGMCNQPSLYRTVLFGNGSFTYTIPNDADQYSLFAFQCVPSNDTPWQPTQPLYENSNGSYSTDGDGSVNKIGVYLEVSMVNIRPNAPTPAPLPAASLTDDSLTEAADTVTSHTTHLAISKSFQPRMYTGLILVHCLLLAGLLGQFYLAQSYAPYRGVSALRSVHLLFLFTELFYIAYLLGAFSRVYTYSWQGYLTYTDNILPALLWHMAEVSFLFSMLVVSLGVGIIKDEMTARETVLTQCSFMIFITLGFVQANCISISNDTSGLFKEGTSEMCFWSARFNAFVETCIYLGAILGMNYNVTALRFHAQNQPWSPSMPVDYCRAHQYHAFRHMFLAYLIVPIVFSIVELSLLTWREDWVGPFMFEVLIIVMFIHVGVTFGPVNPRVLTRAFDGSLQYSAVNADADAELDHDHAD